MAGKNLIHKLSNTQLSNDLTKEKVGEKLISEYLKKSNSYERLVEIAVLAYNLQIPQLDFFIQKIELNLNII